jgi:hypothetical protein
MRIYITSKSGRFDGLLDIERVDGLREASLVLRANSGYPVKYRGANVFVPYDEIEYIEEVTKEEE